MRGQIDEPLSGTDNPDVARRLLRPVAGAVIAPFWVFASAFAPPHAHESGTDHSRAVIHNHFESHHLSWHHTDGAAIEPCGEHVIWLDNAIAYAVAYHVYSPAAVVVGHFEPAPLSYSWSVIAFDEGAPPHGPPRRAASLRGPPILLA